MTASTQPKTKPRLARTSLLGLMLLGVLLLPATASAGPPPPSSTGGGSPEPSAILLLAAGAVPTYAVYRRVIPRR